jgi:hypothetical protein
MVDTLPIDPHDPTRWSLDMWWNRKMRKKLMWNHLAKTPQIQPIRGRDIKTNGLE